MFDFWILPIVAMMVLVVSTIVFLASRYKRCPSDKILVIFGKVGEGQSANCIHGGGALVWPLIQDYSYMSLTPMTISIPLQKALSMQNPDQRPVHVYSRHQHRAGNHERRCRTSAQS